MDNKEKLLQLLDKKKKCKALSKDELNGKYAKAYEQLKHDLLAEANKYMCREGFRDWSEEAQKTFFENDFYAQLINGIVEARPEIGRHLSNGVSNGDFEELSLGVSGFCQVTSEVYRKYFDSHGGERVDEIHGKG